MADPAVVSIFWPKIANFGPQGGRYNRSMTPAVTATATAPAVHRRLDNGLKVIVHELRTVPLVSVWCWYRVGSGDELPGKTGISHWVEHMNFKGTRNISREEMKGLVERVGGAWNGYTWVDQTAYVETASADALDRLLFLEAERMSSAVYDPTDCDAERTVVISELQGGENDPEQLLDQEVTATALRVHPYGHPVLGWLQDLESISRDDLYAHYRRHYVPGNATLVVVGDVDPDEVLRRAERYFGHIPASPVSRLPRPAEPAQMGERRVLLEREGGAAYLKMAYPSPAATEPEFMPMLVLDAVLTGAKGVNLWAAFRGAPQRKARLYTRLVDEGLAAAVSGALLPTVDPFVYTLSFTAADGVSLARLEAAVDAEIERVRTVGISAEELARAKRQLRARLVFDNDSVTNIAHQLGYFETVAGGDYLANMPSAIHRVTAEDVSDVVRRRLAPASRTTGWFQPTGRP